jgi:hypothetical protein
MDAVTINNRNPIGTPILPKGLKHLIVPLKVDEMTIPVKIGPHTNIHRAKWGTEVASELVVRRRLKRKLDTPRDPVANGKTNRLRYPRTAAAEKARS